MSENLYNDLSIKRKDLQAKGYIPEWFITPGLQLWEEKYEFNTETSVKGQFERIARTAASHLPESIRQLANDKFFELLWKGWLSPSTPVMSNMGTNKGLVVSCAGSVVEDSIDGFYSSLREAALLTKYGFGTASYLGDIRPRGTPIAAGGKASGVVPVFEDFVNMTSKVTQGTSRRGAWAGYLPISHGDFDELVEHISANPDGANVGWNVYDNDLNKLNDGNQELSRRWKKSMKMKMVNGAGYYFFPDKANRRVPEIYKKLGLTIKSSQLCNEIALASGIDPTDNEKITFSCVLSSMNVAWYNDWKNTDAVYWATIFLDCVAEDFLQNAKNIKGLEQVVRFTERGRALGLGQCGIHTLFQENSIPFESLDAHYLNMEIAEHIHKEANRASEYLAELLGEPLWCKGSGKRNTHIIAVAPTKSSALIQGGVSEGINPYPSNTYVQQTAAGEVNRVNPTLLKLMKDRNVYNDETLQSIVDNFGSVQQVDWLDEHEKKVFKTAFEIDQNILIRYASNRARYIDQWQSVNLFFSANADPEYISSVHQKAFNDENILGLYYIYSSAHDSSSAPVTCESCQ